MSSIATQPRYAAVTWLRCLATSNFVADAPSLVGFDPTARFVDYIAGWPGGLPGGRSGSGRLLPVVPSSARSGRRQRWPARGKGRFEEAQALPSRTQLEAEGLGNVFGRT